jgi:hypothetical protein
LSIAGCEKKEAARTPAVTSATAAPGAVAKGEAKRPRDKFDAIEVSVPPRKSALHVAWNLPGGTGINDDAPFGVRWVTSDGLAMAPTDIHARGKDVAKGFDVPIELMDSATGGKLAGDVDMVICDVATHAVCVPLRRQLEITLNPSTGTERGSVVLPLPSARL